MSDLRQQAARLEELLPRLMRAIYRAEGEPLADLPLGQLRVVRVLFEGSKTPTELAHELGLTQGAVSQLLQRLEEAALIEKTPSHADRRIRNVRLSASGMEQMCRRRDLRREQAEVALAHLDPQRREEAIAALEDLVRLTSATGCESPLVV